ncbi:MAG: SIS domain-containing protein [Dehalococcoidia bacterium]
MTALDDPGTYALDRSGMFDHIRNVGREFLRAYAESAALVPPPGAVHATNLVIAGVGGSATAAGYFAAVCRAEAAMPVTVVRGLSLPGYVNGRTLVVVCSYSGDTEEALACYGEAMARGAPVLIISRGGELARRAVADGASWHPITYEALSPRATTVHTLAPLLRLGEQLGLWRGGQEEVAAAGEGHRAFVETALSPTIPLAENGAKRLATALHGRFTILAGAEHLAPAAERFRNQLAENGKALGSFESLPELGHNLIVGLSTGHRHREVLALVTLESRALHGATVLRRFDLAAGQFAAAGIPVERIEVPGATVLQQLLTATAWGDYTSCYVALLNGLDPTPVAQIDALKGALRQVAIDA